MHIPDNYLSPTTCVTMVLAMAPVWTISIKKVHVQIEDKKSTVPLLGVGAALSFLLMMFNVPVPGGTTAHAVGATLLAILSGPWSACLSVSIALLLQAFLFGDGGILAYGANVFNMAFIMPFVGYSVFLILKKMKHQKIGVFLAAYVGINVAALAASIELGLQPIIAHSPNGDPLYNPYPLNISVPTMTGVHLLIIGWIEATITLFIYQYVKVHAPEELYQVSNSNKKISRFWFPLLSILAVLSPIGLLASGTAWGEWNNAELVSQMRIDHLVPKLPSGMAHGISFNAVLADYGLKGIMAPVGYILSAVIALIVIIVIVKIWGAFHEVRKS